MHAGNVCIDLPHRTVYGFSTIDSNLTLRCIICIGKIFNDVQLNLIEI